VHAFVTHLAAACVIDTAGLVFSLFWLGIVPFKLPDLLPTKSSDVIRIVVTNELFPFFLWRRAGSYDALHATA